MLLLVAAQMVLTREKNRNSFCLRDILIKCFIFVLRDRQNVEKLNLALFFVKVSLFAGLGFPRSHLRVLSSSLMLCKTLYMYL